jgi:predicted ATPase
MMHLSRVEIRNYKSLRDVTFEPGAVSVFVGPNAAGKTNFADALDFLGDVYRWGLEAAVSRKGGYENISYRHSRRTKAPIQFRVILKDVKARSAERPVLVHVTFDHCFEFRAESRGIGANFTVAHESLVVYEELKAAKRELLRMTKTPERDDISIEEHRGLFNEETSDIMKDIWPFMAQDAHEEAELFLRRIPTLFNLSWIKGVIAHLASLKVFQLSPRQERQPGVPTPNPDLDRIGTNLPAVIAFLQKKFPGAHRRLLDYTKRVMPSMEEIQTGFTHTKTLALFIKEQGFARPWAADDISDGTLQTIALLTAIFDPRAKIVVIEEPENSVHPWALRNLVAAVREASKSKQIILTTHSPILVDQLRPEELWVVQRPGAETRIDPLLKLDPSLKDDWGRGKFTLAEYLDSGAVPDAVPSVAS